MSVLCDDGLQRCNVARRHSLQLAGWPRHTLQYQSTCLSATSSTATVTALDALILAPPRRQSSVLQREDEMESSTSRRLDVTVRHFPL